MNMLELRPLIVITGTIRIEGGSKTRVKSSGTARGRKQEQVTVVQERDVTPDRRQADVFVTNYARKLRPLRIFKTPFGVLIDPAKLKDFKVMMMDIAREVAIFNRTHSDAQLANCLVWEKLTGNRLGAVSGWLAQKNRQKQADVSAALPALLLSGAAA